LQQLQEANFIKEWNRYQAKLFPQATYAWRNEAGDDVSVDIKFILVSANVGDSKTYWPKPNQGIAYAQTFRKWCTALGLASENAMNLESIFSHSV
jgi:hypothetical protein